MKEEFLHYIWNQELFEKNCTAISGEQIEIIHPGTRNHDAGPDFLNARIKIDETIWAGNIEIHTDSSNWENHGHHQDAGYNNVILHVVQNYTKPAKRLTGEFIPAIELRYNQNLLNNYREIIGNTNSIACENDLQIVHASKVDIWLSSLSIERLEEKTGFVSELLKQTNNSWEETFYIMLARSFGFHTNALPFELLAKSLPLAVLSKFHSSQKQLDALLFGQAGFLEKQLSDDVYYVELCKEYQYLKKVYKLKPVENHLWKFLRLRPINFPTIRIAQFSNLVWRSQHLFSKTLDAENLKELIKLLNCEAVSYWDKHYNFNVVSTSKRKVLGKNSIDLILINTIIPFLFLYGKMRNKPELQEKALQFMEEMKPEKSSIIGKWDALGITARNALKSQALIQLTNNYCKPRNCLYCQIGNEIIRKRNMSS